MCGSLRVLHDIAAGMSVASLEVECPQLFMH